MGHLANKIKTNEIYDIPEAYVTFDASNHVRLLHPDNMRRLGARRDGIVSFAQRVRERDKHWNEWAVDIGQAHQHAQELLQKDNISDLYMSQNSFNGWRRISNLRTVGACYVDLDYITRKTWEDRGANTVLNGVLETLDEKRIPAPSFVLSTGRGLLAVWLHNPLPRSILPKWQIVQQNLAEALTSYGADKKALDSARVFRLAGSVNSKATSHRDKVCLLWCQGPVENPLRHSFDELADDILPLSKSQLASLRAERAKRKAEGTGAVIAPVRTLSGATYWESVLTDLQRLKAHRFPEGALPAGQRDIWMFLATNAMSWICPPEVLNREMLALASEATGWTENETRHRMSSILRRARDSALGKKIEFNGKEVDPRYKISSERIVEWLEIDPAEQQQAGLRCLIDGSRRKELNAERSREFRQRQGAVSRSQAQEKRLSIGRQACYLADKDGLSVRELAEKFQVSRSLISKVMIEARMKTENP